MTQAIIYTRSGGGVSVATASPEFMRAACNGGDQSIAVLPVDEWVARKTAQGHSEDAAYRHALAWWHGGCTTAEMWAIRRDIEPRRIWNAETRIEIVTLAPELVDITEALPADRWFRDAWRRAEDGGPIWIDLDTARDIQRRRIKAAIDAWNKQAAEDEERAFFANRQTNGPAIIEFDRQRIRDALWRALTPAAIRAVWPEDLPRA